MFFPQFLSFRTSGAASHTMRERWQETLLEHTGRPRWSSHHGFSMCVIQDLVQGHHSSAQPMATTPRWQALSELPCCGSQASGHMGERCRPLLLKAFSGQTACCLSLNVSGFVPAPLLPWVNWAVPFFLSPRQPKLHFHRWSVPQCQWAGGVTRWPSTFWNWFRTVSFFKGSFGEVAAANWSHGAPSSLLVLNGQQHLINFVLISVGHSWLEKGDFCLSH